MHVHLLGKFSLTCCQEATLLPQDIRDAKRIGLPRAWRLRATESWEALPILNRAETRARATDWVGIKARMSLTQREPSAESVH